MLYDPKWEKQNETKADPFALGTLIAWLEQQPADKTYCYESNGGCLLHKYFTAHGFKDVIVGGWSFYYGDVEHRGHEMLPGDFPDIAECRPRTFGAALKRARAAAR